VSIITDSRKISRAKTDTSPMILHYLETKDLYPDVILFYRLGDFYELFFEDAELCARVLELVLTSKSCGSGQKAAMCGIPYHAADGYIAKLIEQGYRVAICEQAPTPPTSKGLVSREVIRIVTPGTAIEEDILKSDRNNFILSVFADQNGIGACYADISTGLMEMCEFKGGESGRRMLDDLLSRIKPSEIIASTGAMDIERYLHASQMQSVPAFYFYRESEYSFSRCEREVKNQFNVQSLSVFDAEDKKYAIRAAGALLAYLGETQKRMITNIKKLSVVKDERFVHLDLTARRNLELVESLNLRRKKGSLLGLLDHTRTSMGARMMRQFVEQPIRDEITINDRLDGVEELMGNMMLRDELDKILINIQDIERKCGKISANVISPKECLMLAGTLNYIPKLKTVLSGCKSPILTSANKNIADLSELGAMLISAIEPEGPSNLKDGGYIRRGFDEALDTARKAGEFGKQWLAELEQSERERTGIRNLKTGYNRIFGYYIEISNSWLNKVPENYVRKQTTTTGERFITAELKDMEYKILNSKEESIKIESELFAKIKQTLASYINEMLDFSASVATVDCLLSFAHVATKNHYCRPLINSKVSHIKIVDGRHGVVEDLMDEGDFSPNDTILDNTDNRIMLITGPNMAGKSTYMRQVAIITLMAHMGCFVPAREAEINIVDRIFTRVGASDDLAFGRSTFMVEMTEVSTILANATKDSLIILDEVGRGTSTFDGLSIAWAILEYLGSSIKAKTLFSTHYHELTDLEGKIEGIKNYRVMIKELASSIIFMHKIARGSANKSFGIEVAKLSGLPESLVERAKEILAREEQRAADASPITSNAPKLDNVKASEIINILKEIDMNNISPIMAFGTLQNLVDKVKK